MIARCTTRRRSPRSTQAALKQPGCRSGRAVRVGYTLIELLISMGSATVLVTGMGTAVYLSGEAFVADESIPGQRAEASDAGRQVLDDLKYATGFTERTDKAVTFTVPDRTGDGQPDTIRYAWSGTAGDPLTYSLNGATPLVAATNVHQFALTFDTETIAAPVIPDDDGVAGGTILFVSDGSVESVSSDDGGFFAMMLAEPTEKYVASTTEEDVRIKLMESWGYSVKKIAATASDEEFKEAYSQADVVYIPEGINSMYIAPRVATMSLGIVNESQDLVDDLGFGMGSSTVSTDSINVVTTEHSITEHLAVGPVAVTTSSTPLVLLTDVPSPDLQSLGALKGPTSMGASLMALNADALDYDGRNVASRRVQLSWGYTGFDPQTLTDDGQELMRRSIDWAMGNGPDGVPNYIRNFGFQELFATPVSNVRRVQFATRVTLREAGVLRSISAYVGGASDDIRFAIYSDIAGEPGVLLAESPMGETQSAMHWLTLNLPETSLSPGAYWLALSFESNSQTWLTGSSGGQSRMTTGRAARNGFSSSWGTSTASSTGPKSIYATYMPASP